ncbi:MAG: response regulator [Candidatus Omnitrophota bacterium]
MRDKKRILICDDEEGIRESLKLILEKDYDLVFAKNGNECLSALKNKSSISLVLLDIKMPVQNGLEVTQCIKEKFPDKKVIIVTGYKSAEIAQEAAEKGAIDYIVKPFDSKDILEKVKNNI